MGRDWSNWWHRSSFRSAASAHRHLHGRWIRAWRCWCVVRHARCQARQDTVRSASFHSFLPGRLRPSSTRPMSSSTLAAAEACGGLAAAAGGGGPTASAWRSSIDDGQQQLCSIIWLGGRRSVAGWVFSINGKIDAEAWGSAYRAGRCTSWQFMPKDSPASTLHGLFMRREHEETQVPSYDEARSPTTTPTQLWGISIAVPTRGGPGGTNLLLGLLFYNRPVCLGTYWFRVVFWLYSGCI